MGFGIGTMIVGGTVASLLGSVFPPVQDFLAKEAYSFWPAKIMSPGDLLNIFYKGWITDKELSQFLKENGYNADVVEKFIKAGYQNLNAQDYIHSWRRDIIDEKELNKSLTALRYNDSDISTLKQVSEFFPSPADLVTFAVREVYTPSIRERFGLDLDRPEIFMDEAKKAGLPAEQAKNYWASHWQLPSPLQGFEMLHRQVIDSDDLNKLLKALDIVPFWREKLQKISYNPLTRVDVRRMYGLGVLDDAGVHKAYLDVGYDQENAALMTEFTKKYENEKGNELTKSAIINSYKKDIIDEKEAYDYLIRIGYNDESANFHITTANYDKFLAYTDALIDELEELYKIGDITIVEVQEMLNTYDLPASQINAIILKLKNKSSIKKKIPARSDLETWLKYNIIDEKEYFAKMLRLGYGDNDIRNYLTEINLEIDTSKRKYLPIKTYLRWYSSDIMSENDFIKIARELKIAVIDIEKFLSEVRQKKLQEQG